MLIDMVVGADGTVRSAEILPRVGEESARSSPTRRRKLARFGRADSQEGAEGHRIEAQLRLQAKIAAALRKTRLDNGALEIETVEARAVSTDGSRPGSRGRRKTARRI